jgi:SAM-dependent methyltransferase
MSLTPRQRFAFVLRKMHLLQLADLFWFLRLYWLGRKANVEFTTKYTGVPVPPPMLLYDVQGNCDLSGFYYSGQEHAHQISKIIAAEYPTKSSLKILEWGCGPARVLQHLTATDDSVWELWGADYNPRSISWCRQHWPKMHFMQNGLEPPISLESEFFDVIYCISVFTHLSEVRHYQWIAEIVRLLKPGGLFIGTFHGEMFRDSLTDQEQHGFDRGELVIRKKVREGKKDFSAYHCDNFVQNLLAPFVRVIRLDVPGFRQTVWTAKKKD